jgi:hypothetical protein
MLLEHRRDFLAEKLDLRRLALFTPDLTRNATHRGRYDEIDLPTNYDMRASRDTGTTIG